MRRVFKTLSRAFETDAEYLAQGTFWLTTGKVVGMAASFLLSIAYARYLSKDLYGSYRYVLSMLGIAGILALPGIGTAIVRSVAQGFEGTFRRGAKIIFFSSFGISLVGLGFALIFFVKGSPALASGFLIGALFVPFGEGLGNWRGYYEGKKDFRKKTFYNIASHVFYAVIMLAAIGIIFFKKLDVAPALVLLLGAYFLAHALPNILFFRIALRQISKDAPEDEHAIPYGLHLSMLSIPATVANYIDSVLLYAFLGPAALATYSFALAPIEQLKAFFSIVPEVAFPKLSEKTYRPEGEEDLKKSLVRKSLRTSVITVLGIAVYIFLAPYFFQIFFPRYIESVKFSQVFSLSLALFPFTIFNVALKAEGNIKKIYIYNVLAPVIQIAALLALIPFYGLWGAVWGKIIGRSANYFLPLLLFRK